MDTRPSTDYHPPQVKFLNDNLRALNAAGVGRVELNEPALLAAARRDTGLERLGDESFLPALRLLLTAIEAEQRLNPIGRIAAHAALLSSLKNRLWANACFEAHPQIRHSTIAAPIVIVGLARSGTTRLHRMLAADPRLQHLKAWEGSNPAPRLSHPQLGATARYQEVKDALAMGKSLNPGADSAHPVDVDGAEEEILLLNHSFASFGTAVFAHERHYYTSLLELDRTAAYSYLRDLLQLISWSRGDQADRRWVLKTPQHMLDLDKLLGVLGVFPDAKLIFTHRDPLKTVISMMSLSWHLAMMNTDLPCRAVIRDMWLDVCEHKALRSMRARASIPAAQQLDVYYHEMNRDWRRVLRRVSDFIDLEFTPDTERLMSEWLARSESENRHGAHRYSYEDFGITHADVEARMRPFRERYAIPLEGH
jgi:hypothetical protein